MIQSDFTSCFLAALFLLILPFDWILVFVLSAFFHEVCHIIAVILFGGKITRFNIKPNRCCLESCGMGEWGQFFSILAGPLGSLSLLLFCRTVPKLAICGLFQGIYNLLPIIPLDGGRMLRLILYKLCPEYTDQIMNLVLYGTAVFFGILALLYFAATSVFWPIILAVIWNLILFSN